LLYFALSALKHHAANNRVVLSGLEGGEKIELDREMNFDNFRKVRAKTPMDAVKRKKSAAKIERNKFEDTLA
jgi:hypothetical protein